VRSRSIVVPLTLSAALVALLATGCESFAECDPSAEANPEQVFDGGYHTTCFYSSSVPPDGGSDYSAGELLLFKGGTYYALNHHLPCVPWPVYAVVSFEEYGTRDDGDGVAPAAGNQAQILGVDETAIHVANGSCADYWLLVTASCASCP
jgi:hypothetical protein